MTAMSLWMTVTGRITQAAVHMQGSFGKMEITMAKTLTDLMKTGQKAAGIMMLRRKMITVRMTVDTVQKMILTTGQDTKTEAMDRAEITDTRTEASMSRKEATRTKAEKTGKNEEKRSSEETKSKNKIPLRVREIRFEQEPEPVDGKGRNTELGIVTYTFVFLFLLMVGYLTYLNVFKASELNSNAYNTKQDANTDKYIRGSIVSADGNVLAQTQVADDGTETRVYPYANVFAHAIGYSSNGKAGLEAACNYDLLDSHASVLSQLQKEDENEKTLGDSVVVTLNTTLQNAAYQALGGYNGAVVALEPKTGKILAMVSKPDYDPNAIEEIWESVVTDSSSSVLLNRATQGLYPPGSTFKILTTLAFIRQQPVAYKTFDFTCNSQLTVDDVTINCYNGNAHGEENLEGAFTHSCNTAFAQIGLDLDNADFRSMCEEFLFNKSLPTTMQHSTSQFALTADSSYGEQMTTAIGQGDTLVTPLHMALITATVANGGIMMKPYMVDHIEASDGTMVSKNSPSKYKRLMTTEEAKILTGYMKETVLSGTASALNGYSFSAAGKTGSAEYGANGVEGTHSWFVGFSNVDDPDLVVAVIAEDGGTGSQTAVPIAAQVFQAYYSVKGIS